MSIKHQFKIDDWDVTFYYVVSENQKMQIFGQLMKIECDKTILDSIVKNISDSKVNTGFTYSNFNNKCSLIVIHKSSDIGHFLHVFEQEKEHLEMHICEAYDVNPYSEEAAVLGAEISQVMADEILYSIDNL